MRLRREQQRRFGFRLVELSMQISIEENGFVWKRGEIGFSFETESRRNRLESGQYPVEKGVWKAVWG